MRYLYFILLILLIVSCNDRTEKSEGIITSMDTNYVAVQDTNQKNNLHFDKKNDSLINKKNAEKAIIENGYYKSHFDFNDLSNEGGEGYAYYDIKSKKIKKSEIKLFGEREQTSIQFDFLTNKIKIIEITYGYKKSIDKVKSNMDMTKQKEITYVIDYNGVPIGNADKERLDIFQEFKKAVPFELK